MLCTRRVGYDASRFGIRVMLISLVVEMALDIVIGCLNGPWTTDAMVRQFSGMLTLVVVWGGIVILPGALFIHHLTTHRPDSA